ncbi:MAG: response regulator, partial [Proteobacteria bacterium]
LPRLAALEATPFHGCRHPQKTICEPLRILVVDDNTDAGNTLAMLLGALGHMVVVEADGLSALARAKEKPFDVGLFDIGLPDITGNELACRIRAHPSTAVMTLLAVTGYGQKQDEIDSAAAGFDHHLVKPVNTERLSILLASLRPVNVVSTV